MMGDGGKGSPECADVEVPDENLGDWLVEHLCGMRQHAGEIALIRDQGVLGVLLWSTSEEELVDQFDHWLSHPSDRSRTPWAEWLMFSPLVPIKEG